MAIKELQTRIALKYDSYSAWTTAPGKDLVLLPGELGICYIGDSNQESNVVPTVLFKVGDGSKTFENLPWASAKAADVYSWAKASDVVYNQTAKTITFVKGNTDGSDKVITFNYMTEADVKGITDGLASRIQSLESKFTGTDSVQGQIDALDGRLDVIEGSGEGSVAKALVDAKAYTDAREVEIKKYADQAEADAKTYTDGKVETINSELTSLDGRLDVIEGEGAGSIKKAVADAVTEVKAYADTAESDAVTAAKAYTDEREVEINKYADQAEADAKTYTDSEVDKLEAEDLRLAGLISGETSAREGAINAINTKIGSVTEGKDVVTMISDAQSAAVVSANGYADEKVQALADGQVKTNKEAIDAHAGELTRIEGLVTAETTARETADNLLSGRLDVVEAFFETAEGETLDTALDTLKEIQDYLNGEGNATNGIIGRVAQAETDIDNLETRATNLEAADTALGQRIDALVGDEGAIATGDAATLASAKSYTDGRETLIRSEIETAYKAYADTAESDAVNTAKEYTDDEVEKLIAKDTEIEEKVTALQTLTGSDGAIQTAIKEAKAQADKGVEDAGKAQAAADKAQGEVDTLEGVVATLRGEYDVTKALATANEAAITALDTRVGTAEGNITTLQGIVNSGEGKTIRDDVVALQTLTGENGVIRQEIADAKQAGLDASAAVDALSKGQVATNKTNIEGLDTRITNIENDYLKAADVFIFQCGSATTVTHEQPKPEV